MKPGKVIVFSSDPFAFINFRRSFLVKLVDEGYEAVCLMPPAQDHVLKKLEAMGVRVLFLPIHRNSMNFFDLFKEILAVGRIVKHEKPSHLFSFFIKPNFISGLLKYFFPRLNVVVMFEGAGSFFEKERRLRFRENIIRRLGKWSLRLALRRVRRVIFLNSADLLEFTNLRIIEESQGKLLGPIGVNVSIYPTSTALASASRFLLCARMIKEKGVVEFVEAAKRVGREFPHVEFLLLGDVDSNPSSFTTQELGNLLSGTPVRWLGHKDPIPFYRNTSVFVLPTFYREGSPRSVQEAMACGIPVITTNVPGCKELIMNSGGGVLIDKKCCVSLEHAMRFFIENPIEISRLGSLGQAYARTHLRSEIVDDKLMRLVFFQD